MDERGTPINRGPVVNGKDLNLYKLYRLVDKKGGYNRITNKNLWREIYNKMGLPPLHSTQGMIVKRCHNNQTLCNAIAVLQIDSANNRST